MRTFLRKIKIPVFLLFISTFLMLITGMLNYLNLFNSGWINLCLFNAIIFSAMIFFSVFIILFRYLHDYVFTMKPPSTTKGQIKKHLRNIGVFIFALVISLTTLLGVMLSYYYLRPAPIYTYPSSINLSTWTAIPSGDNLAKHHKSNTEMIYYNNSFYMVYQNSKWHLQDQNGELVVAQSPTATKGSWQTISKITIPNTDVRDPLLSVINNTIFLYFLPNFLFDPEPEYTYYCSSDNGGITWTSPEKLFVNVSYSDGTWGLEDNWCFGRVAPQTNDNLTWYVVASGSKGAHVIEKNAGQEVLFKTTNGTYWEEISVIYDGYPNSEATLSFLPNGELISTIRVETMSSWDGYIFGTPHAGTIIATSFNNFQNWSIFPDFQTRLDGARLFTINNRTFAAGRNHLGPGLVGNHLGRKRTAIYEVKHDRLIHLFDLPSNGDTAYTGAAVVNGSVYVCYYTNPIEHDLPWIVGLAFFSESEIRMAKFNANGLISYANSRGG
ncbi:MAG: exo-alpha-sialidase [Promethearchaeota archaeon]|nr:MAG: exo-alpha-sialidase [Candidatus Lokiarchaeota archaeon]